MPRQRPPTGVWPRAALALLLAGCTALRPAAAPPRPETEKPAAAPAPVAPVLAPEVSPEEAERLSRQTRARVDATEELVRTVDEKTLPPAQAEAYATIQSFLEKAKEALQHRDLQRAAILADKAGILAEELVRGRR
jgi:hypothetical protein